MSRLPFTPSPLTLGTVQIGLPYGLANSGGLPDADTATAILDAALGQGITSFDTARAYGLAEERLGRWAEDRAQSPSFETPPAAAPQDEAEYAEHPEKRPFQTYRPHPEEARRAVSKDGPRVPITIVTKTAPLPEGTPAERMAALEASLAASRAALRREALDLVLTHREADLLDPAVAAAFEEARAAGVIGAYGASVYGPEAALRLIDSLPIAALQLPLSAADRRFERAGVLEAARRAGVAVFTRSAFLQGALLMAPEALPPHLAALVPVVLGLREIAEELARPLAEVLLLMARDTAGVASVVVGVERPEQLAVHAAAAGSPPLPADVRDRILALAAGLPDEVLNPGRWPKTR